MVGLVGWVHLHSNCQILVYTFGLIEFFISDRSCFWSNFSVAASSFMMDSSRLLRFARLSSAATAPIRGSAGAVGFDLSAAHSASIPPGARASIQTDIQVHLPPGCYGRIAPRSGLALTNGIDVFAGVIDTDFRGNVSVLLCNFGGVAFQVSPGDRVAQLILEKCVDDAVLVEVEALEDSVRGAGAFGSTGVGAFGSNGVESGASASNQRRISVESEESDESDLYFIQ